MRSLLLILIILVLNGCATLQSPEVKSISNIRTAGLLSGQPRVNFNLLMNNPNGVSIALTDFNVEVNYGKLSLATFHLDTLQQVPAQSDFSVPLSFAPSNVQMNNMLQSGLGILSSESTSKLNGTGSVRVRKFIFNKTFRFSF